MAKHAPWKKGESGNPNGRPKGGVGILIREKKGHAEELFKTLEKLRESHDENIVFKATIAEIEFGWGKAVQAVEMSGLESIYEKWEKEYA